MRGKSVRLALALVGIFWGTMVGAAGWDPKEPQGARAQVEAAHETIAKFKATDPGLEDFFQKAYGYAVFPL